MKSTDPATLTKSHQMWLCYGAGHSRTNGRCTRTKAKFCSRSDGKKTFEDGFLDEAASSHHFGHFGDGKAPILTRGRLALI